MTYAAYVSIGIKFIQRLRKIETTCALSQSKLGAKVRWGEGELHVVDVDDAVVAAVAAVAVESGRRRRCTARRLLYKEIFHV